MRTKSVGAGPPSRRSLEGGLLLVCLWLCGCAVTVRAVGCDDLVVEFDQVEVEEKVCRFGQEPEQDY